MTGRAQPTLPARIAVHIVVYTAALTMLLPVAWMASTSLKTHHDSISAVPTLLPPGPLSDWQWRNYADAWSIAQFGDFYRNSLVVALIVTVLSVAYNALAGFAFAKLRFRGRTIAFSLMLATMLLPFQVYFIFAYVVCGWLGYIDHLQALIVPFLASAFGIFYMRQSIISVPDSLLDAGRIDGLGDFELFWHIVAPLVRPALGALAIFTFMASWNSFFWPLIVIDSTDRFTLPLAVNRLTSDYFTPSPPIRMAAATILIVPTVLVYLIFERSFVKGLSLTGVKG